MHTEVIVSVHLSKYEPAAREYDANEVRTHTGVARGYWQKQEGLFYFDDERHGQSTNDMVKEKTTRF